MILDLRELKLDLDRVTVRLEELVDEAISRRNLYGVLTLIDRCLHATLMLHVDSLCWSVVLIVVNH